MLSILYTCTQSTNGTRSCIEGLMWCLKWTQPDLQPCYQCDAVHGSCENGFFLIEASYTSDMSPQCQATGTYVTTYLCIIMHLYYILECKCIYISLYVYFISYMPMPMDLNTFLASCRFTLDSYYSAYTLSSPLGL